MTHDHGMHIPTDRPGRHQDTSPQCAAQTYARTVTSGGYPKHGLQQHDDAAPAKSPTERSFLLVDDDAVSIMAMKRALKHLGVRADNRVARDGLEALDILEEGAAAVGGAPPFVVALDYNMPRMNGPELLKAMRSHPALRSLPVFMFSAPGVWENDSAGYSHDVDGYLCKDNLLPSLSKALARLNAFALRT